MPASPREFFESLESRVDSTKAAGLTASYVFEIDGAGMSQTDLAEMPGDEVDPPVGGGGPT